MDAGMSRLVLIFLFPLCFAYLLSWEIIPEEWRGVLLRPGHLRRARASGRVLACLSYGRREGRVVGDVEEGEQERPLHDGGPAGSRRRVAAWRADRERTRVGGGTLRATRTCTAACTAAA